MRSHALASALLLVLGTGGQLSAQGSTWAGTPADSYADRFQELWKVRPATDQAAKVNHLVLKRDAGELVFETGTLYLLQPIGGQVMGALFRGTGTFNFSAPIAIEQERLKLFRKSTTVAEPFEDVVLLFADSTLAELRRQLTFGAGEAPFDLRDRTDDALEFLGNEDRQSLDPDVMRAVLNGEQTGFFYAHMVRGSFDPWMFFLDPQEVEGVRFLTRGKRTGFTHYAEPVAQFPRMNDTVRTGGRTERRSEARVERYTMRVSLSESGGGVDFRVAATLALTSDTAVGPWVAFSLFGKMTLDSARYEDGRPAVAFKGKDSRNLWLRLEHPLKSGDVLPVTIYYHGDVLRRAACHDDMLDQDICPGYLGDQTLDLFYIKTSIGWYPVGLDARQKAIFDLTFDSPAGLSLASVGVRSDSAGVPDHMIRTRWVTPQPIRNASFNLGVFEPYPVQEEGVPPVTVLWSETTHRALSRAYLSGKNMQAQVGGDIGSAMRFYEHVYGEAPVQHFYATEIPDLHGEAWPGIIGLSYATFLQGDDQGENEVFRAHEVAHQWWGIAVDYATYRDRWISEGFADFSGLWYMQTRRKSNDKYFGMLDRWKADILLRRDDALPIWLGHRVATAWKDDDYDAIIYKKGAWVLHMLRILLLDMKTMSEDRFTGVMQNFYTTFRGRTASTADFQRTVERATGQDMTWFFRQWIYGGAIPTYRVAKKIEQTPDGKFQVTLRVDQERVPPEFLNYVPVTLDLGNDQVARVRVKVTGARSEIALPVMPAKPKAVRFNDMDGVLAEVKEVAW